MTQALTLGTELCICLFAAILLCCIILMLIWKWICHKNYMQRLQCSCRNYYEGRCLLDKQRCPCTTTTCPKLAQKRPIV